MWFSRKVLIHPQHPPVQWNLRGISVEQSTKSLNWLLKGWVGHEMKNFVAAFLKNVLILYCTETVPEAAREFRVRLFFSVIS
jgi:hypothetical protein